MTSTNEQELVFTGLSGSSLLGFLAALGTLHTLDSISETEGTKMQWNSHGTLYYPSICLPASLDREWLLSSLDKSLKYYAGHATVTFASDLKITPKQFRHLAETQCKEYLSENDRLGAAVTAAFGCESVTNDEGNIEDTAFRTMSGAGHQHFLAFMNELAKNTHAEHLREAIFGPWRFRDPSPTMRWDEADDRRYALRWDEPSKDPVRTVRGANRLAIAGLPFFTVAPTSSTSVATTGFAGQRSNNTFFSWPLWSGWLGVDVVRSLLAMPELQKADVPLGKLHHIRVHAVCRSQRVTLGKYRNFTPAKFL